MDVNCRDKTNGDFSISKVANTIYIIDILQHNLIKIN